jgi:hypothetical protein
MSLPGLAVCWRLSLMKRPLRAWWCVESPSPHALPHPHPDPPCPPLPHSTWKGTPIPTVDHQVADQDYVAFNEVGRPARSGC